MAETASICGGFDPISRLKGVNALGLTIADTFDFSGKKSRESATPA
jgi:hypothetical protein